ncbi:MAG: phosphoenolpyruvate--protein phosphotransferase [Spirochaetales bacterium]|nr:phosphoenolpyruvate--protein phosphotransferase [Spirochaetales bacterium]
MNSFQGEGVSGGITLGNIFIFKHTDNKIEKKVVEDYKPEIERFSAACEQAISQLQALSEDSVSKVGEEAAQIFMIHSMMIEDDDYQDFVINKIKGESVSAEYAVFSAIDFLTEFLNESGVAYIEERKSDIMDITNRIISILRSDVEPLNQFNGPVILAAEDLTPSQTVQLERDKILSIVTKYGTNNSHTAILSRTMGIPSIVGLEDIYDDSLNGRQAVVDADNGVVIIEPDEQTLDMYQKKIKESKFEQQQYLDEIGKETVTTKGRKIKLYANIGDLSEVNLVKKNDAEGIGLFRSEFIFLGRKKLPSEDEQLEVYRSVAESLNGAEVIIRTLDIGADKQVDYLDLPEEDNPALGLRAVRLCFERTEIFKTQLRALYRASAFGSISIMFPMIISVEEIIKIKDLIKEVCLELDKDGFDYNHDVKIGIMIETPAAAIISADLAEEADFFSIGTNDLSQYTLALDRQNPRLTSYAEPHHKAVLDLIKLTAENAHKKGIWVGVCGEMAADLELTDFFIESGIDELSVAPPKVLPLRKRIRESGSIFM